MDGQIKDIDMNRFYRLFLYGLVLLLISCNKDNSNSLAKSQSDSAMVVTTIKPKYESYPVIVTATGTIQPWQETIISAEIGGIDISNVYVNVGDKVKKGQLLAELNAAQVNADLLGQKANVAEAQANLEQATIEFSKATGLEKAGALSSQELLNYSTKQKTTQAKLLAAKANLELQKIKLGYTKILSPDNGVISSRSATAGSTVNSGGELFRLIRNNHLEWQAEVPLSILPSINSGQNVLIKTLNGEFIHGKVRQVAPVLNTSSKSGLIYVDIYDNEHLKVGMILDGVINSGTHSGLVVPFRAVLSSDGFNYVMEVDSHQQVHKIKVKLGDVYQDNVVITEGLSSSMQIVLDGAGFLNESETVIIRN